MTTSCRKHGKCEYQGSMDCSLLSWKTHEIKETKNANSETYLASFCCTAEDEVNQGNQRYNSRNKWASQEPNGHLQRNFRHKDCDSLSRKPHGIEGNERCNFRCTTCIFSAAPRKMKETKETRTTNKEHAGRCCPRREPTATTTQNLLDKPAWAGQVLWIWILNPPASGKMLERLILAWLFCSQQFDDRIDWERECCNNNLNFNFSGWCV